MAADLVAARREALERAWELGAGAGRWEPLTLAGAFEQVARRAAERPCVIADTQVVSYGAMRAWSRELARGLLDLGLAPGDRVGILIDNRPEFVAVRLAVAWAGGVAVPLNYQYRSDDLAAALAHARVAILVTVARSFTTDLLAVLDALAPGWEPAVHSPRVPALRTVVLVDPERPGALDLRGLAARGSRVPESALEARVRATDPDAVSDVLFTSGTSGRPLAAALTHDMVLRSAYGSAYHRGFADGWRSCFALPLYHVFAYVEGLLAAWFVGGAILPRRIFNPRTLLEAVDAAEAQEILAVPTMTVGLVEEAARGQYALRRLESLMSAAAAAPVWLWERVQRDLGPRMVCTGYGQTEVSAATALTQPGDPLEVVAETVGCPKLGGRAADGEPDGRLAAYRTVEPFSGTPLPAGEEGELCARGPIVARAYDADPARTRERIDPDGWLRSGDLGRVRPDGYLTLTGRASELYKVGGELVAPKEVEAVLTRQAGVAQAYVAGVPDPRRGEVGWAWVVPDGTLALDPRALIRACRASLAPFKVPRVVRIVDAEELPTTTTGKVQKYRLVDSAR